MGRKSPWLIGLMALAVVCYRSTPSGQQPAQPPPLPQAERFIANNDLHVSLLTTTDSIRLGERLTLTLRFENRGSRALRVVPRLPDPVFASASRPVAAMIGSDHAPADARRIALFLAPERLVTIQPGERWDMPLDTESLRTPPRLAPGEYTATATYVNYPDYEYLHYHPPSMPPRIWEGMLRTAAVRFTVTPPAPDDFARWQELLQSDKVDRATLELLAVSGDEGVSSLLRGLGRRPEQILWALRLVEQLQLRDVIAAIDASTQSQERASLLGSAWFESFMQGRVSCDVLEYLGSQLGHFHGPLLRSIASTFASMASACPGARTLLRDLLLDVSAPLHGRSHAAALLGEFRHPDDRGLLIDILERRIMGVPAPSPSNGDPVRAGAVVGLSRFTGRDVVEALARTLADEQGNVYIRPMLLRALFDIGGPDVIPPLTRALASTDSNLVVQAVIWLPELKATDAVPRLVDLLNNPHPTVRIHASGALRRIGGPPVREAMLAAAKESGDTHADALFYLVEHGDASLRELFLAGLESQTQSVREAAIDGIRRFGTEADFPRIRRLFDSASPEVRGYLPSALGALTFAVHAYPADAEPAFWDNWYARHRGATRVAWAREALARADAPVRRWPFDATAQRDAIAFLTASRDPAFCRISSGPPAATASRSASKPPGPSPRSTAPPEDGC